ncbi:MAG: beta-ketoacyl-[acyl-carrier-protein] synthase family protein [Elusimicrobia bacterium]|nr:beta-ketoacyl-[acyl-carrier-protein] synthase family protein [Elusimicrobiota bacterium]
MRKRRVVATGLGTVSPFGLGIEAYWNALLRGESAVRPIERFDAGAYRSRLGAEVPRSIYDDEALRKACGGPAEDSAFFMALAADEALRDARVGPTFTDADRAGCVLGTLCASAREMMMIGRAYLETGPAPSAELIDSARPGYQLQFVADRYNLTGPTSLVSTACASSTDALGYAFDLIQLGECDRALAGGGDVLVESIHGGFNSMFALTTEAPRPFDRDRDGFCIGEGAGAVYLESLDSARARGAGIYAEILGYGLSNTAHHLTATSEDGAGEALAIRRALDAAEISPDSIDYINTHGTATRYNDATEIRAVQAVFGSRSSAILANSNKSAIGHCMGAAGALEALSTILVLKNGAVPPTPFTRGNADGMNMDMVRGVARRRDIRHALSQSFGFGGACSCIVLGRWNGLDAKHD